MDSKCPKCGAEKYKTLLGVESWACDSFRLPGKDLDQSDKCLIAEQAQEIEELRQTNKRLNRRAQAAEKGVLAAVRGPGVLTFGRALANSACSAFMAENKRLRAKLEVSERENAALEEEL